MSRMLRLSEFEVSAMLSNNQDIKVAEKTNKYRNKKTGKYDSKKESQRAQVLKYMQHAGEISELVEQPKYVLIEKQDGERPATYTADFRYVKDGQLVVEDVKSSVTRKRPEYVLRRKLMLLVYGIKVLET